MKLKYRFIALIFFMFSCNLFASDFLVKGNENLVFGFVVERNKKLLSISIDKNNQYIVYRYGLDNRIELEFPEDKSKSFDSFIYSYYFRGGPGNAGMDLNWLRFYNDNHEYVIYHEYVAENSKTKTGVKIKNLKTEKSFDIKGDPKSVQGSLIDFRFTKIIKIDEFSPE